MGVQLGSAFGKISIDSSGVQAGVAVANSALQQVQEKFNSIANDLRDAGLKMTAAITLPLVGIGKEVIGAAGDYEAAMSKIAGLTDASKAQVKEWSDQILEMSKTLPQAPKELADGLYFVVSAGFKGSDAMTVLEASAKASAAGLGDMRTVADAVTSTLNAYQMGADKATFVTDVLTNAVVQGKMPPEALAGALGRVLPIAAALGVPIDQVASSLATMTRTGLSADEAATALRGVMGELIKPGTAAKDTFIELGTSVDKFKQEIKDKGLPAALNDLMSRAEKMAGTTVTLTGKTKDNTLAIEQQRNAMTKTQDTIAKLNRDIAEEEKAIALAGKMGYWKAGVMETNVKKLADMKTSLKEQNSQLAYEKDALDKASASTAGTTVKLGDADTILSKIFPNIRAFTGVLSMAGSQAAAYTEIQETMNNSSGRTDKAFRVATDNFDYQVKVFRNNLSVLAIQVGSELLPALTPLIKMLGERIPEVFGEVRKAWDSLSPQVKTAALAFGAVAVAAGPILLALSGVATILGVLLGPVGLVLLAVALLATAWATDFGGIQEKTKAVIDFIVPAIQNGLATIQGLWVGNGREILKTARTTWSQVQGAVQGVLDGIMSVVSSVLPIITGFWQKHGLQITIFLFDTWQKIMGIVGVALQLIATIVQPALNNLAAFINQHGDGIVAILSNVWTVISTIIGGALSIIQGVLTAALLLVQGDWSGAWAQIQATLLNAWEDIKTILSAAVTALTLIMQPLSDVLRGLFDGVSTWIADRWKELSGSLNTTTTGMVDGVTNPIQSALNDLQKMWNDAVTNITSFAQGLGDGIASAVGGIVDGVKAIGQAIGDGLGAAGGAIGGAMQALMTAVMSIVIDAVSAIIQPWLNLVQSWWDRHGKLVMARVNAMWADLQAIFKAFGTAIQTVVQSALSFIESNWAKFSSNVQLIVSALGVMLQTIINLALAEIQNRWSAFSQEIQLVLQTLGTALGTIVQALLADLTGRWNAFSREIQMVMQILGSALGAIIQAVLADLTGRWNAFSGQVSAIVGALWAGLSAAAQAALLLLEGIINGALAGITSLWTAAGAAVTAGAQVVWSLLETIIRNALTIVGTVVDAFTSLLIGDWKSFDSDLQLITQTAWDTIQLIFETVTQAITGIVRTMWTALGGLFNTGKDTALGILNALAGAIGGLAKKFFDEAGKVGGAVIDGMKIIMEDKMEKLIEWVIRQMQALLSAAKAAIGMGSPSKEFEKIGESIPAGVVVGIKKGMAAALAQTRSAMQALVGAGSAMNLVGAGAGAGASTYYQSSSQSMGGVSAVFNVYDAGEMDTALAWVEQQRTARLNATMGG